MKVVEGFPTRREHVVPVVDTLQDFDLLGERALCVEAITVVLRRDDPTILPGDFSSSRRRELDDRW